MNWSKIDYKHNTMENTQESKEEFKTDWNKALVNGQISLLGLKFLTAIEEEISKIDCTGKDEIGYFSCQAYHEALKKSIEIFRKVKEDFNK